MPDSSLAIQKRFIRSALSVLMACVLFNFIIDMVAGDRCDSPIQPSRITSAGSFQKIHYPNRPRMAVYSGIGLYQMPGGRWTGYQVSDPAHVDFLIQRCADHGITQISAHMTEEYERDPRLDRDGGGTNALIHRLVSEAHKHNILVYADIPTFAHTAVDRDFTARHPGMFTRSVTGELDTRMLSPGYPEVREHKQGVLLSLVREYPVDGVHLDFIRFPYYTHDLREGYCKHGYDAPILKAYRELNGQPDDYAPNVDELAWVRFRATYVTSFIRELRDTLHASGINLPIAVYNSGVYGADDSLHTVLQDWQDWNDQGLVDEHHPMFLMSGGMTNLVYAAQSLLDSKPPRTIVFGPVFLAEGFRKTRPTPDMVRDAARRLIRAGCDGLWFCRPSEIEEFGLWPVVEEISQWSISEIRRDRSDPARVELLRNSRFSEGLAHWQAEPGDAVHVGQGGELVLPAGVDLAVSVAQSMTLEPLSTMPVASLDIVIETRSVAVSTHDGLLLFVELIYADGQTKLHRYALPISDNEWHEHEIRVPVDTDYHNMVLQCIGVKVVAEAGAGTHSLRRFSIERDRVLHE